LAGCLKSTGLELALSWENVHLNEGFVNVKRAWKDVDEIETPKWDHVRSVPFLLFSDRIMKRLKELREMSIRITPKTRNLSPHSFRHSLNTLLRDRGKDAAKIREVLGWHQERTQDRYPHFNVDNFEDLRIDRRRIPTAYRLVCRSYIFAF